MPCFVVIWMARTQRWVLVRWCFVCFVVERRVRGKGVGRKVMSRRRFVVVWTVCG